MIAKCPKCNAIVHELTLEPVSAYIGATGYKGVAYCCRMCGAVLGAGLDPLALKTDIVDEVVAALRKG